MWFPSWCPILEALTQVFLCISTLQTIPMLVICCELVLHICNSPEKQILPEQCMIGKLRVNMLSEDWKRSQDMTVRKVEAVIKQRHVPHCRHLFHTSHAPVPITSSLSPNGLLCYFLILPSSLLQLLECYLPYYILEVRVPVLMKTLTSSRIPHL